MKYKIIKLLAVIAAFTIFTSISPACELTVSIKETGETAEDGGLDDYTNGGTFVGDENSQTNSISKGGTSITSTPEPTPEPTTEPEPTPIPTSKPEPTSEPTPKPDPTVQTTPEPTPTEPFDKQQPWTGTWKSNSFSFGTMILMQNDNTITGTTTGTSGGIAYGSISGSVSSNILTGEGIRNDGEIHELRITMSNDSMELSIEVNDDFFGWLDGGTATRVIPTELTEPLVTLPPGDVNIDQKLTGSWELLEPYLVDGYWYNFYYYYIFHENGNFEYGETRTFITKASGKYSVSNGKITFTDISYERGDADSVSYTNKVFEQKIENKDGNPLLRVWYFSGIENAYYFDIENARMFKWKN